MSEDAKYQPLLVSNFVFKIVTIVLIVMEEFEVRPGTWDGILQKIYLLNLLAEPHDDIVDMCPAQLIQLTLVNGKLCHPSKSSSCCVPPRSIRGYIQLCGPFDA